MSFTYPSSSLDSLALDPLDQPTSLINEEAAAADLALWTNAKFTYDVTPGQGILEDKTVPFDLGKAMYEHLAQYLDLDMSVAQQPTLSTTATTAAAPTSTTTSTFDTQPSLAPLAPTTDSYKLLTPTRPPTLLPKPSLDNGDNSSNFFLLPGATTTPYIDDTTTNENGKRTSTTTITDDRAYADDDKRRRNTAASARFRIKKKQKEQAMAQTVQEMTAKSDKLQQRVHELENEIKWLRELLLEKNASK